MIGRPWLFLAALLLASLGLNLPGSLAEAAQPWFWRPPVEFVLAVLLVILCGGRLGAWSARAMGACLAMMILVRIVDLGVHRSVIALVVDHQKGHVVHGGPVAALGQTRVERRDP